MRADFFGREVNVVAPEGAEIGDGAARVVFDPAGVNVYSGGRIVPADGDKEAA